MKRRVFWGVAVCCALLGAGAAEKPRIVAHRGGRAEFDDNAAGGFRQSLAWGITGYETDVRATRDGALVIMHDDDVARTTTGTGKVSDMTCAAFKALALKAAMMYPEFHYVGWDICMTENGPAIIEGNDYPGYDLAQIPDDGDPHPRYGLIPRFEQYGIEI